MDSPLGLPVDLLKFLIKDINYEIYSSRTYS
jgi:hypothetical protein